MVRDDMNIKGIKKIHSITTCGGSLKAFEFTCVDCKIALERGACKSLLPVKHDITGVTEELGIEPFIDDQDTGVTDDEDVEDQEDMERLF